MRRLPCSFSFLAMLAGIAALGCESGGVGDPCIPEDEYVQSFPGFTADQINTESRSFQCETRVCLVANFQGRVSCPYGQPANSDGNLDEQAASQPNGNGVARRCRIPGTKGEDAIDRVTSPVSPQLVDRGPKDAVYCSCRCDGPDPNANYCECPSGFVCAELINDLALGSGQLAGSYCIRQGTKVNDPQQLANGAECNWGQQNCGEPHPKSL